MKWKEVLMVQFKALASVRTVNQWANVWIFVSWTWNRTAMFGELHETGHWTGAWNSALVQLLRRKIKVFMAPTNAVTILRGVSLCGTAVSFTAEGRLFYPENGSSRLLRNVHTYLSTIRFHIPEDINLHYTPIYKNSSDFTVTCVWCRK
jgi:hypothetical protein